MEEINFQINESTTVILRIDQEVLCSRSNLLKGIFESCEFKTNKTIKLTLERPEKFSVLFHYIETGKIGEELKCFQTFISYINDIIYLGIQDLETHALDMLQKSLTEEKSDQINFLPQRPGYDFMERFIRERASRIKNYSYSLCVLICEWIVKNKLYEREIIELLKKYVDFKILTLDQIIQLRKKNTATFELLIPPSIFVNSWTTERMFYVTLNDKFQNKR